MSKTASREDLLKESQRLHATCRACFYDFPRECIEKGCPEDKLIEYRSKISHQLAFIGYGIPLPPEQVTYVCEETGQRKTLPLKTSKGPGFFR
jgi:hypothetical protein